MLRLLRYFLIAVLIAFTVATVLLAVFYRQSAIDDLVQLEESNNVALTQAFANSLWERFEPFVTSAAGLGGDELRAHPETAALRQAVLAQMRGLPVLKAKLYDLAGLTVFSTEASQIGEDKSANPGYLSARAGFVASELTHRDTFSAFEGTVEERDLVSSYIPVRRSGPTTPIEGVFEVYTDVTPLLQKIEQVQRNIVIAVILVLAVLYAVLFFAMRRVSSLIRRQMDETKRVEAALQAAHAELEKRVEQRTAHLRASADVARAAASILDPDQLLREVVNLITSRFGFYYTAVFTLDEAGRYAVLREATGPQDAGRALKEHGHKLEVGGESMVGYAAAHGVPRVALDVGKEQVRFANPLLPDTRSEIALPLVVGARVLGALDVQSTEEAAFDEASVAVLQSMADQVAVAIANAESFETIQVALETTTRLYEAMRALFAATSEGAAYQAALRAWTSVPGLDRLDVFMISQRDAVGHPAEYWAVVEWDERSGSRAESGARYRPDDVPLSRLATDDAVLVVRDADDSQLLARTRLAMQQAGVKAALVIPLVIRGRLEGLVIGTARQPVDLREEDVRFMQAVAEQLSVVLGGLRANEETQAALARVEQLNRRLVGEAWRTYLALRPGELTAESGEIIASQETSRVAIPIVVRGETLGALTLEDDDPARQWSDEEWDLLSTVAGEIGQMMENARLIERSQLRASRESQLNAIAQKIRRADDVELILKIAAEELGKALDASHARVMLGAPADLLGQPDGA